MPYYGYYNPYQPMQDNLQQLRNQMQQPQIQQVPIQGQTDDKIFVQGELAAQAYLVAPNSFVRLWDSQANVFYEKRADASGRPYMDAYEYKKRDNLTTQAVTEQRNTIDYENKINALSAEISTLRGKIEALERMKGVDSHDAKSNADDTAV